MTLPLLTGPLIPLTFQETNLKPDTPLFVALAIVELLSIW